jgi:hypothetical protein
MASRPQFPPPSPAVGEPPFPLSSPAVSDPFPPLPLSYRAALAAPLAAARAAGARPGCRRCAFSP